jgi:hypothetical protein
MYERNFDCDLGANSDTQSVFVDVSLRRSEGPGKGSGQTNDIGRRM